MLIVKVANHAKNINVAGDSPMWYQLLPSFPLLFIWPLSLMEIDLVGVRGSLAGNNLELHMVPSQHITVPFICFDA